MKYQEIRPNIFECKTCPTRCDGVSKGEYIFQNDAAFSDFYEQKVIDFYNSKPDFSAYKTTEKGYPDIIVKNKKTTFYIEIKVQRRTFMSVQKYLTEANLFPSETIALNQSDLVRYFDLRKKNDANIYVMWILLNRPCILNEKSEKFYIQDIRNLQNIFQKVTDTRRFRRKSGEGDIVDGQHKGVVVNYHFSLNELKEIEIIDSLNNNA